MINYQGDLKKNQFTYKQANFAAGVFVRVPISNMFTARAGVTFGKIDATDRYNRNELKPRNLSFATDIKEIYAAIEATIPAWEDRKFNPYLIGGAALFHFNPWTRDPGGEKIFLKPLSTEGQGLSEYPDRNPYQLTQSAIVFGGGIRHQLSPSVNIGLEITERKTFTDYIDDVSSTYVDQTILLRARGPKAVELAYRADELPGGNPLYPGHGKQRGATGQKDWYYFVGLTLQVKIAGNGEQFGRGMRGAGLRCPRFPGY